MPIPALPFPVDPSAPVTNALRGAWKALHTLQNWLGRDDMADCPEARVGWAAAGGRVGGRAGADVPGEEAVAQGAARAGVLRGRAAGERRLPGAG